ncbi:hypothetical protein KTD31_02795 [Burkholderia multivorans]|uniref:TerC family protein n=1 Tax=Burkholderia multivorans TaxID=87883 RepID=UPI001C211BBE|nr:hypothetical protein [Burkholderia multivorans]MDN8078582.1 hypothetical protein [Burkholderia multivorans]
MTLFPVIHFSTFVKLGLLDLTLGLNNAVLIVPTFLSIPVAIRHRAMLYGIGGAIVLRALMLILASFLVGLPFVDLLAGTYLLHRGYRMLVAHDHVATRVKSHPNLFLAAAAVVAADASMSIDNVLALAATAHWQGGIGYAIAAVCVSIPAIMFGSGLLAKVVHRLPVVVWFGGALLGFVGATIAFSDPLLQRGTVMPGWFTSGAPWLSAIAVICAAQRVRRRTAATCP